MVNRVLEGKYNIWNKHTGELRKYTDKNKPFGWFWITPEWYPIYDSRGKYLGYKMYGYFETKEAMKDNE